MTLLGIWQSLDGMALLWSVSVMSTAVNGLLLQAALRHGVAASQQTQPGVLRPDLD